MISPLRPFFRPNLRAARASSRLPATDRWLALLGNYRLLLAMIWVISVLVWVVDEASPAPSMVARPDGTRPPAMARVPEFKTLTTQPPREVWGAQLVYAASPFPASAPSPQEFE